MRPQISKPVTKEAHPWDTGTRKKEPKYSSAAGSSATMAPASPADDTLGRGFPRRL